MDNRTIQFLEEVSPRAAELLRALDPEYREGLTITIPLEGGWPYFAVHFGDKIQVPADPKAHGICSELSQILRKECPDDCIKAMEFARQVRQFGPGRFGFEWQGGSEDLIDSTANLVHPVELRLPHLIEDADAATN